MSESNKPQLTVVEDDQTNDTERRLAIATELLRQAENLLGPSWPRSPLECQEKRMELKSRVGGFLDEEYRTMGVENRRDLYA